MSWWPMVHVCLLESLEVVYQHCVELYLLPHCLHVGLWVWWGGSVEPSCACHMMCLDHATAEVSWVIKPQCRWACRSRLVCLSMLADPCKYGSAYTLNNNNIIIILCIMHIFMATPVQTYYIAHPHPFPAPFKITCLLYTCIIILQAAAAWSWALMYLPYLI